MKTNNQLPMNDSIFKTYLAVVSRVAVLANALYDIDRRVSVNVEWSTKPMALHIIFFRWNEADEIEYSDYYTWYYDNHDAEQKKEELFAYIAEWEEKYGLERESN